MKTFIWTTIHLNLKASHYILYVMCNWVDNNVGILPTRKREYSLKCIAYISILFGWQGIYETFCARFDCLRFITLSLNEIVLCVVLCFVLYWFWYHLQKHISNWIFYQSFFFFISTSPQKLETTTTRVFFFSSEEIYISCVSLSNVYICSYALPWLRHATITVIVFHSLFVSFALLLKIIIRFVCIIIFTSATCIVHRFDCHSSHDINSHALQMPM